MKLEPSETRRKEIGQRGFVRLKTNAEELACDEVGKDVEGKTVKEELWKSEGDEGPTTLKLM